MRSVANVKALNLQLHETMPITLFSHVVRKDDGIGINYLQDISGFLFVEVRCRLAIGARILVMIPDEELVPTIENYMTIGERIGGAAFLLERHCWN